MLHSIHTQQRRGRTHFSICRLALLCCCRLAALRLLAMVLRLKDSQGRAGAATRLLLLLPCQPLLQRHLALLSSCGPPASITACWHLKGDV